MNEKPAIIFYTTIFSATGGGQHAMALLARELVGRGYPVEIFTRPPFSRRHRYVQWLDPLKVRVHVLSRPADRWLVRIVSKLIAAAIVVPYSATRRCSIRRAWTAGTSIVGTYLARRERAAIRARLALACGKGRPTILHIWGPAALTPLLLEWAEERGVAAVYHEMGEADEPYVRTWNLQPTIAALSKANAVVCCSTLVERCVRTVYGYQGPIAKIPFMIADPPLESGRRPSNGPFTIGTIGRLVPHKRQADLIEAVRTLRDMSYDVRLVIAGHGPERLSLERQCEALGVADRVEFLGEFESLAEVMTRFDVFALTSSSESQCMPITESMAYGKPAVVSAVGGMPDFVEDGVTGYIVPLGDAAALVAALRRLSEDPMLRARMGELARARYRERYRPGAVTTAIERVYSQLFAGSLRPLPV